MKRLVVVEKGRQGREKAARRPRRGQDVYIGVDVARSKWVYKVRWDAKRDVGRKGRKVASTAA